MSRTLERLQVLITADGSQLSDALTSTRGKLDTFGKRFDRLGRKLAGVSATFAGIGAASVKLGIDAQETANKFDVVFGGAAQRATERLDELGQTIPLTRAQMQQMASGVQDLLVPLGLARESAADLSLTAVELAGDLASFNNVAPDQVLQDIQSALAGSSEPMRKYGVDTSVAALKSVALANGLIKAGEELDRAAAAQAVLLQIQAQSSDAMGDAARTADGTANSIRFLMRDLRQTGETIGQILIPVLQPLLAHVRDLAGRFSTLSPEAQRTIVIIGGIVAAVAPAVLIIGQLAGALAVLGNPIGLAIAAVAALTAAWLKWGDDITAMLAPFVAMIGASITRILEIIGPPVQAVLSVGIEAIRLYVEAWRLAATGVFEAVKSMVEFVTNLVNRIREIMGAPFRAAMEPAMKAIGAVKGAFKGLFDAVVGKSFIPDMVELVGKNLDTLEELMVGKVTSSTGAASGLFSQMRDSIGTEVRGILGMVQQVLSKLSGGGGFLGGLVGGITGFLSGGPLGAALGFVGGFAQGGVIPRGGTGLVGEAGPELITAGVRTTVTPMGGLTLRLDASSLPPMPRRVSPDALAVDAWWREAFSNLVLDGRDRGVL